MFEKKFKVILGRFLARDAMHKRGMCHHALSVVNKMHYPDRLKQLNMSTLTYRRSRGDVLETYKVLTGKYDQQVALTLPKNVTVEYLQETFTRKEM